MWIYAAALMAFGSLEMSTGTIVVLENSHPIVELYTRSEITHVGMIVLRDGKPWVYEATPSKVRRLTWAEYVEEIKEMNRRRSEENLVRLRLYQPHRGYSADEREKMLRIMNAQLGRRYSVRGYFRKEPGDGVHCAEFVSTVLAETGRYPFTSNYAISPAKLVHGIRETHLESQAILYRPEKTDPQLSWCERSRKWWGNAFAWCGWACHESWVLCRD